MSIKIVDLFVACSNCGRKFSRFDPNRVELEVTLDDVSGGQRIYCSEKCMETKVKNLNPDKYEIPIIILEKERISNTPSIWAIKCKTDLKVEIL